MDLGCAYETISQLICKAMETESYINGHLLLVYFEILSREKAINAKKRPKSAAKLKPSRMTLLHRGKTFSSLMKLPWPNLSDNLLMLFLRFTVHITVYLSVLIFPALNQIDRLHQTKHCRIRDKIMQNVSWLSSVLQNVGDLILWHGGQTSKLFVQLCETRMSYDNVR